MHDPDQRRPAGLAKRQHFFGGVERHTNRLPARRIRVERGAAEDCRPLRQVRLINPPFENRLQGIPEGRSVGRIFVGPFEVNTVRPPEAFGLVLKAGWDDSGRNRAIDPEMDADREAPTFIRVDCSDGAGAHSGEACERSQNVRPIRA